MCILFLQARWDQDAVAFHPKKGGWDAMHSFSATHRYHFTFSGDPAAPKLKNCRILVLSG